ncbi:MAG: hypothetical protein JWP02_2263 [Acidimicrobiales bacterium]|nr:hypothetical protein [Acidimicrobiales bacterium]
MSRHVITVAHEGGHAVVGLMTGRRLAGVRLHSDASGLTITSGRSRGLGLVATMAAGYLTPSLLGLGAAWLLAEHYTHAVLMLSLVLLAAMGLSVRNLFGLLTVVVLGGAVFAVLRWSSPSAEGVFAWTAAWVLLLGGLRAVWELQRSRRTGRAPRTDADQLAILTHLPAALWVGLFALTSLATVAVGARWLILTTQ